jgi:exosome complex component RRP41
MLELYPRSEINITVHVLESDGSIICSMINAVTLALMDAGIAMSDMYVSLRMM